MKQRLIDSISLDSRTQLAVMAVAMLFYSLVFDPIYRQAGDVVGALLAVPVALGGLFFGMAGGLATAAAGIALTGLLFYLAGPPGAFLAHQWPNLLVCVATGAGSGWIGELLRQSQAQARELEHQRTLLEKEIAERRRSEASLRQAHDELESRVVERTEQLAQANVVLQAQIAEREQSEQELRRSEFKSRALIENSLDIITILDDAGTIRYESPSVAEVFGYTPEELIGQNVFGYIHPDDVPRTLETFNLGKQVPGMTLYAELRFRHKNGSWRYLESIGTNLSSHPGLEGTVVNSRDITERKQVEGALRETEFKYRNLLDHSGDGITLVDEQGRVIEWNRGQEQILDLPRDKVLDRPMWDIQFQVIPPERRDIMTYERVKATILHILATGELPQGNRFQGLTVQRPDGTRRHLQTLIFPIKTEKGYRVGSISRDVTELKQAEDMIRRQNEFLETVIESLASPFLVIDPDDYGVQVSNRAAQALARVGARTCYILAHNNPRPCDELGNPCPLRQVKETRAPVVVEHVYDDANGHKRHVEVHSSPILDGAGRVVEVIEYCLDVTERNRAQYALAAEKERLAITLSSIGDGVITTDRQERIMLFNTAAEELTGWSCADAVGRPLLDVFHIINRKTREMAQNPAHHVLVTGEIKGLAENTALIARDGSERIISSSVAPIRDPLGYINGVVLVFRDISQLKIAEEALRDSREYARNLIDSSLDMIIAVDNQRRIVEFNKAAQQTFGYEPQEILGKNVSVLYANDEAAFAVQKETVESGRSVREVLNRRKNGDVFPSFLSASVLHDSHGRPVGFMGVSRDITERKLAEEQNIKAQRLAALGRLSAALAHEINNPLQAIRGTLDLVLDFPLEADEREKNLAIVRQEIERLSEVAARVLQYARPTELPRRPISVTQLLEQTLTLTGKQLQHSHVQVHTDWSPVPPILAAPEQLTQVFVNLVLNAIEAMHDGGHLDIGARAVDGQAVISFANDGPSIPPDVLPHIFEPFFTTKPDGSGLGLSVSRGLVEQHGGRIAAQNLEPDRGVVFTLHLPLASSNSAESPA